MVEPVDMSEANELMPCMMEIGMLNGHSLVMLKDVLNHVRIYTPLLFSYYY